MLNLKRKQVYNADKTRSLPRSRAIPPMAKICNPCLNNIKNKKPMTIQAIKPGPKK